MLTEALFFYIFAAMVLGGAILTITRKNAVHSAMFLIVSLMGVKFISSKGEGTTEAAIRAIAIVVSMLEAPSSRPHSR